MKKLLRHLSSCGQSAGRGWPLLLALALSALWAAPVQATYYSLRICGVQVTDENKDKLSSSILGVKSGTVTYNPATKTLRLKNARLETGDQCIENAGVDGLTVEVEGTCRMTSDYRNGILLDASTTITGVSGTAAPSLVISASSAGVWVRNRASCTISGLDLTATGKNFGLTGNNGEPLTITDASVRATGASGSICDFSLVTLAGCYVLTPGGAAFHNGTLSKDGGTVTGEAVVGKKYDLKVCDVQVTDANKDDLSAVSGVTGTAAYDSQANKLRLKGTTIKSSGSACIQNSIARLSIEVEGKCKMESNAICIYMDASTIIEGKSEAVAPSLVVSSGNCGVYAGNGAWCTIRSLDLTATGRWGIAGNDGKSEVLTIKNATVRATGTEGSICDFKWARLDGCYVFTPEDAAFDGGTLKKDGAVVTGEVLIGKKYDLKICGVQVTDANKDDLSVIDGVKSGTVTYNPATKTLRLKDTVIKATGNTACIENKYVDGLTIVVEGKCRMESSDGTCVDLSVSTVIEGKSGAEAPSLEISAGNYGIQMSSYSRNTISDLDLTATGEWGIAGSHVNGEGSLTIKNATVRATGTEGSIIDFPNLWGFVLVDCQIVTPAGAKYYSGSLKLDGKTVKDVLILPDSHPSVGIGTTAGDAPRREGVYTLSGVRLATPLDQLPRGVYVVDGQKVVKK